MSKKLDARLKWIKINGNICKGSVRRYMIIYIGRLMTSQEFLEVAYINLKKEMLLVPRGESLTSQ